MWTGDCHLQILPFVHGEKEKKCKPLGSIHRVYWVCCGWTVRRVGESPEKQLFLGHRKQCCRLSWVTDWNQVKRRLVIRQSEDLAEAIVVECPNGHSAQVQGHGLQ